MKKGQFASLMVAGMFVLSACNARGDAKPIGTISPQGTEPVAKPAATAVNKSALPAGGDVSATPTAIVTGTVPVTLTTPITNSTGVTVTTSLTPTAEITPTGGTTVTTTTGQVGGIPFSETDTKTLTTKGTLNIRSGPAVTYRIVGFVRRGKTLNVTGVSTDKRWWRVQCLTDTTAACWVIADARFVTANK